MVGEAGGRGRKKERGPPAAAMAQHMLTRNRAVSAHAMAQTAPRSICRQRPTRKGGSHDGGARSSASQEGPSGLEQGGVAACRSTSSCAWRVCGLS